jgi:hypothetical protein
MRRMSGVDVPEVEQVFQQRKIAFKTEIEKSKELFIKSQMSNFLLAFLVAGKTKLDKLENQMSEKLNQPRASGFAVFFSRNKVHPLTTQQELSVQQKAEFQTAKLLLLNLNYVAAADYDDKNYGGKAQAQKQDFEDDIELLKSGARLKKHWNDTTDPELFTDEIAERKLLGTITNKKILTILNEVDDNLVFYPEQITSFLVVTRERVEKEIEKIVDAAYKEFIKTPFGEYVTEYVKYNNAKQEIAQLTATVEQKENTLSSSASKDDSRYANKVIAEMKSQIKNMNSKLPVMREKVIQLKQALPLADLSKVGQLEKIDRIDNNKLDILLATMPSHKHNDLIQKIDAFVNFREEGEKKNSITDLRRKV